LPKRLRSFWMRTVRKWTGLLRWHKKSCSLMNVILHAAQKNIPLSAFGRCKAFWCLRPFSCSLNWARVFSWILHTSQKGLTGVYFRCNLRIAELAVLKIALDAPSSMRCKLRSTAGTGVGFTSMTSSSSIMIGSGARSSIAVGCRGSRGILAANDVSRGVDGCTVLVSAVEGWTS